MAGGWMRWASVRTERALQDRRADLTAACHQRTRTRAAHAPAERSSSSWRMSAVARALSSSSAERRAASSARCAAEAAASSLPADSASADCSAVARASARGWVSGWRCRVAHAARTRIADSHRSQRLLATHLQCQRARVPPRRSRPPRRRARHAPSAVAPAAAAAHSQTPAPSAGACSPLGEP